MACHKHCMAAVRQTHFQSLNFARILERGTPPLRRQQRHCEKEVPQHLEVAIQDADLSISNVAANTVLLIWMPQLCLLNWRQILLPKWIFCEIRGRRASAEMGPSICPNSLVSASRFQRTHDVEFEGPQEVVICFLLDFRPPRYENLKGSKVHFHAIGSCAP